MVYATRNGGARAGSNSVYQIDFTAVASGKRIASSKRRIRWRFGFTNQDALAAGETGTACRGEEHDVTIVWSVTSGKRLILADGQEVHYSINRNNVFDFSWRMRGDHILKIVAHASPPMNPPPGYRQYDFWIDGQSFFMMPKVYRLGLSGKDSRNVATAVGPPPTALSTPPYNNYSVGGSGAGQKKDTTIAAIEAPRNADEEKAYLQHAIEESIKQERAPKKEEDKAEAPAAAAPAAANEVDLLDFSSDPAPAPAPVPALPPSTSANPFQAAPAQPPAGGGFPPAPPAGAHLALPPSQPAPVPTPFGQPQRAMPSGDINRSYSSLSASASYPPLDPTTPNYSQPPPAPTTDINGSFTQFAPPPQDPNLAYSQPPVVDPAPAAPSYQVSNPFEAAPQQPPPLNNTQPTTTAPPPAAPGSLVVASNQQGNWGNALGPAPAQNPYGAPPPLGQPQQTPYQQQQQPPSLSQPQYGVPQQQPPPLTQPYFGAAPTYQHPSS